MHTETRNNLIIYGGSFDPIHQGHLNTALAVQESARFERFLFLPCKQSLLKNSANASCHDRLNMLKLALDPYPEFTLDTYEITNTRPSYMIETLEYMRAQAGLNTAITLMMGLDTFAELPLWNRWTELLSYSHLMIIDRPNYAINNLNHELLDLMQQHQTRDKNDLLRLTCGTIYLFNAGQHDISSSFLRAQMKSGQDITHLTPDTVKNYIKEHALYR